MRLDSKMAQDASWRVKSLHQRCSGLRWAFATSAEIKLILLLLGLPPAAAPAAHFALPQLHMHAVAIIIAVPDAQIQMHP